MKNVFTRTWVLLTCTLAICAYALAFTMTRPEKAKADMTWPHTFHLRGNIYQHGVGDLENFHFFVTYAWYVDDEWVYDEKELETDDFGDFDDTITLPDIRDTQFPVITILSSTGIAPYCHYPEPSPWSDSKAHWTNSTLWTSPLNTYWEYNFPNEYSIAVMGCGGE